jgi:hypothetical protein
MYSLVPVYSILIDDGLDNAGCLIASFFTHEEADNAKITGQFGRVKTIRQGFMIIDENKNPAPSEVDVFWTDELLEANRALALLNAQ